MRPTSPPVSRAILRCAAACWRCGSPILPALTSEPAATSTHQALLRYVGCNADTHLLAAAFGDEIAMRQDLARINLGDHKELVDTFGAGAELRLRRCAVGEPRRIRPARPCRRAECQHSDSLRPLRGGPAHRRAHRAFGRDLRESRPDLRALGRPRTAPRPLRRCRQVRRPPGDARPGCDRSQRASWPRGDDEDDRRASRRRLRAPLADLFVAACRPADGGSRRAGRSRDDPGARTCAACDARRGRPATRLSSRSPT